MDIISIIKQRIKLQTNQNILQKDFGVKNPLLILDDKKTINEFKQWTTEKQNKFIVVLGGKINFNKTKDLLNQL